MKDIKVQLPYGPPPVLPDVEEQLKEYLLCPDRLPIHDYEKAQEFWPRQPDPSSLFHYELSPLGTTLKVDRDHTTGEVLQFREVPVDDIGSTAKNSMSLRRAPCLAKDAIRGTDSNYPFWPGGFPVPSILSSNEDQSIDVNFKDDLLFIAPGMKRGMRFKLDGFTPTDKDEPEEKIEEPSVEVLEEEKSPETEASPVPNLMDMLQEEENLLGLWKDTAVESEHKDAAKTVIQTMKVDIEDDLKVIPEKDNIPVLKISEAAPLKKRTKTEWAEVIDISTFPEDKLPSYPEKFTCNYQLDTFQKHAILLLENRSHVFVAAPTSAGKTIVAEYAIALSMERKSKTVYTSPIKALSNQKFHEFKQKWGQDVGLITGDVQINKTGSCLIMTTEILRSMLYQGSNVIQDIEFVIFDEVHYVNNVERGYVWEEVLILLPDSVVIVMLSATVPNTLEFANWVGRTKQKKMSVITIEKRPVPLEYYLYPATMKGKNKNSTILIMDSEKRFKEQGYLYFCSKICH